MQTHHLHIRDEHCLLHFVIFFFFLSRNLDNCICIVPGGSLGFALQSIMLKTKRKITIPESIL